MNLNTFRELAEMLTIILIRKRNCKQLEKTLLGTESHEAEWHNILNINLKLNTVFYSLSVKCAMII